MIDIIYLRRFMRLDIYLITIRRLGHSFLKQFPEIKGINLK